MADTPPAGSIHLALAFFDAKSDDVHDDRVDNRATYTAVDVAGDGSSDAVLARCGAFRPPRCPWARGERPPNGLGVRDTDRDGFREAKESVRHTYAFGVDESSDIPGVRLAVTSTDADNDPVDRCAKPSGVVEDTVSR